MSNCRLPIRSVSSQMQPLLSRTGHRHRICHEWTERSSDGRLQSTRYHRRPSGADLYRGSPGGFLALCHVQKLGGTGGFVRQCAQSRLGWRAAPRSPLRKPPKNSIRSRNSSDFNRFRGHPQSRKSLGHSSRKSLTALMSAAVVV